MTTPKSNEPCKGCLLWPEEHISGPPCPPFPPFFGPMKPPPLVVTLAWKKIRERREADRATIATLEAENAKLKAALEDLRTFCNDRLGINRGRDEGLFLVLCEIERHQQVPNYNDAALASSRRRDE